ncbi:UNVERIFIED_CONTAM: hypothetical protein Sradi_1948500 [Sesamum radiatum]|uniref:Uncharacterized protein n=1 Tax=Sesamum radiatum TaxID=300843 RepID=A0AAW2TEV1_SESRA
MAASNSLMVFCFCNFIIAILVVGSSSKPTSQFNQVLDQNFNKSSVSLSEQSVVLVEGAEELPSVSIIMVVDNETTRPSGRLDDDDDELKRRVEEFIEKINKGWRAEKVRSHALGQ